MAGKSLKTTADIIQYATRQYDNGGSVIVESFDLQQLNGIIDEAARRNISVRTVCKEIMSRATTECTDTTTDDGCELPPRMAYRVIDRESEQSLLATDDLEAAIRLFQSTEGSMVVDRDGNELPHHGRYREVSPTASGRVRAQKQHPERKAQGDTSETARGIVRKGTKAETDRVAVVTLTDKQRRFIAALANEPFYTGADSCVWIDCFADTLEADDVMGRMTAGAMVSTLREKGIIVVAVGLRPTPSGRTRKSKYFKFTDVGLEVIANEKLLR